MKARNAPNSNLEQVNVCTGSGFMVLDILMNGKPNSVTNALVGGSFGNVLTILSYLHWKSYPVVRLGNDTTGEIILRDLKKWNVNTDLVSVDSNVHSPVVIQRMKIIRGSQLTEHCFELRCPNCGAKLPKYRPILDTGIAKAIEVVPSARVFYFDRARPSVLKLAKLYKEMGALVFFEPQALKDTTIFRQCLEVTDVLKYSDDSSRNHATLDVEDTNIALIVRTLGSEGLEYCWRAASNTSEWHALPAYEVKKFRDAAGSGDWCSAGLIATLVKHIFNGIRNISEGDVIDALNVGQAFAALNCYYEGARGCMYNLSERKFWQLVGEIQDGSSPNEQVVETNYTFESMLNGYFCPKCSSPV